MLDWSVLIIPLAVLAIILLLPFAGCGLEDTGEASGEPTTIETTEVSITLFWNGSATDIQQISFTATVQPENNSYQALGSLISPPGTSPSGWSGKNGYLPAAGNAIVAATIPKPLAAHYLVKATVTVKQGALGTEIFPVTGVGSKTFDDTQNWHFFIVLGDGPWTVD